MKMYNSTFASRLFKAANPIVVALSNGQVGSNDLHRLSFSASKSFEGANPIVSVVVTIVHLIRVVLSKLDGDVVANIEEPSTVYFDTFHEAAFYQRRKAPQGAHFCQGENV